MRKELLYTILIPVVICSCKKDKLTGEKDIFVGKWAWVYTSDYDYCDPEFPVTNILTPTSESTTYTIEFHEKGKVRFIRNDELLEVHRVVFSGFGEPYECSQDGYIAFGIWLNNNNDSIFEGCVIYDTLIADQGFPFPDSGCHIYTSYFVRTE